MTSVSKLPTLAPPEYLHQAIQAGSDIDIKFYSAQLGLKTSLRRIPNDLDRPAIPRYTSAPFGDAGLARSEAWNNCELVKSSKKRRWVQFKRKFISCIKSIKCRFTVLGLFFGWLTSLGAIIPIVVLWLRSTTTNPASSDVSTGFSLNVSTLLDSCTTWYCQERVYFSTNVTIVSLSLIITVQSTPGETYNDLYSNSPSILGTQLNRTSQIIYTFVLNRTLSASDYVCGAGFHIPGLNRTTNADTYVLKATNICGITKTISGTF